MLASEVSDRAARVLLFAAGCFFIERDLFHMVYAYSSVWLLRGCHFEGYDCMCISCLSASLPLLKKTVSILDESTLAAEQLTPEAAAGEHRSLEQTDQPLAALGSEKPHPGGQLRSRKLRWIRRRRMHKGSEFLH